MCAFCLHFQVEEPECPLNEMVNENDTIVKAEPTELVEGEFGPTDSSSIKIEELNFQPSMDEEEIDHEMLNDAMEFECVSKRKKSPFDIVVHNFEYYIFIFFYRKIINLP